MEQKAVAVACEHEGHVQRIAIGQRLLHTVTEAVLVVLGLDHRDGLILLVAQQVVGAAPLAAGMQPPAHDDTASGERHLLAHLHLDIPAGTLQRRCDELGTDVPFAERLLIHGGILRVDGGSGVGYPSLRYQNSLSILC